MSDTLDPTTPDVTPAAEGGETPALSPVTYVPKYGSFSQCIPNEDGTVSMAVYIVRAKDVEYAQGITLKTHLIQQQALISQLQANTATLTNYVQDLTLFMTERFGYKYGEHSAAEAFVPLFENVQKVPSVSDPIV